MNFPARLQKAMRRADKSQAELARASNLTPATISAFVLGRNAPRGATAMALAQALNVRIEWLLDGTGPMTLADTSQGVQVPLLLNAASAGPGDDAQETDVTVAHIVLDQQFVQRHVAPTAKTNLRFLHAFGDSMEPTISSGDILLVDAGVTSCKIDGVYVFRAYGRLFVKRLRQRISDGKFVISSDNPSHTTHDVLTDATEVECLGRVLYVFHVRRI